MTSAPICPSCGAAGRLFLRVGDLNHHVSDARFDYGRCPVCRTVFLWPVPADLGGFYPADYYTVPTSTAGFAAVASAEAYKLEIVGRFRASGRLLEIGPATGAFAYLAKQHGFEVDAIEMDAACCVFLESLGIRAVRSGDPAEALRDLPDYDVITLWHVLEHVPGPWRLLEQIADRLRPGGVAVLAVPNPEALQFRLFGRFWTHVDAPRHLQLVPLDVLEERAAALGLSLVCATYSDPGGVAWNRFGWQYSLRNLSGARTVTRAHGILGRAAEIAAAPLERRGRRGCTYTAVLKRR